MKALKIKFQGKSYQNITYQTNDVDSDSKVKR